MNSMSYRNYIKAKLKLYIKKMIWFVGWEINYILCKMLACLRKKLKMEKKYRK